MSQDFYVGYSPKAPPSLGRWVARAASALVLGGCGVGALITWQQADFADSKFEYGVVREYSGVIEAWPYPTLRTASSSFLLVAPGKHGLAAGGFDGKSVALRGTLIERGPDRMLEAIPDSLREIAPLPVASSTQSIDLGFVRLRGEIVDSKCYLGVMNPGSGKVHRDCAARCISGGAPPAFIVRDASGETRVLLLVGSDGRALNWEILSYVAEPLEIPGRLVRSGSQFVLKADPAAFLRSPE
jgi:hypothetical protein